MESAQDEEVYRAIPKIELHAHLNGSLRDATVVDLLKAKRKRQGATDAGVEADLPAYLFQHNRSLEECFQVFGLIHKLTNSLDVIKRITREVLEDFAEENVKYIELRTTPKDVPPEEGETEGMTKRQYVAAVLSTIDECSKTCPIRAKLLLSINRAMKLDEAREVVLIANEFKDRGVVGIDFSGNPLLVNFVDFIPVLEQARGLGLPITVHLAEVLSHADTEAVLRFKPERVGHACYLDKHWDLFFEQEIPLEVCLSSNRCTMVLQELDTHHFRELYQAKHPVVLCTDDKGIFSTSLSHEYALAAVAFGLSPKQLFELSRASIECIFAPEHDKEALRQLWRESATTSLLG